MVGPMYQGNVKDEFKRQHATVMWALDLLPRKYTLEDRAAVVVGALHQNYVLVPRRVFDRAAARTSLRPSEFMTNPVRAGGRGVVPPIPH